MNLKHRPPVNQLKPLLNLMHEIFLVTTFINIFHCTCGAPTGEFKSLTKTRPGMLRTHLLGVG